MPAGTFNTVISISEKLKSKIISGVTFGMMGGGKKPTASKDAKKYEGPPFVPSEVRKFVKKSLGTNFKMLHSSIKQCSSAMHFMSGVNTPVVHTTAHAFGYSDIVYCERLTPLKPALSNLWGIIPACIVIACYLMAFFMTMIPGAMSLVTGYRQRNDAERLKMLDELMTKDFKSSGMVKVDCVGISKCGKTKAEVSFYSNHDAGLGFTAKSMVTVAGLIVPDARQEKGNGFGTAVATVGPNQIIAGLRKNGIGLDEAKVTTKK